MIRSVCCAYVCLTIYHHPPPPPHSPLCCSSGKGDTGLKLASRFDRYFFGQGNRIWYRVGPHLETMEGGGGALGPSAISSLDVCRLTVHSVSGHIAFVEFIQSLCMSISLFLTCM